ncbi:hypothetical protein [Marinobacter sp. AL4B]|uniref:hypothetical protein n=1 Tax=Marinobacter sp. AL4B TaxID=2871173 RepID=UPI001CAA47A3|nr:hypothetical protein [Marinobacter sp. AL4B]MBZ0335173.1 hypothetical protein [Marinobacter sp. AL4B]
MSEYSAKQSAPGCSPTCEDESLIIEVIGKEHPEGHAFRIFDEINYEQQEWLEKQVEIEPLENSILHVWPWKGQPDRNVWIEIEAEGGPIRVPFLESAGSIDRQIDQQQHVILPIIPATLISGVELQGNNPVHHVLARAGFLYLFHEGKLWRELEIRIDESGVTKYCDVRLNDYRQSNGKLEAGYRDVVGVGIEEIWLPARINGSWLNLQAAYSESQWPGERVNHLELSDHDRGHRCNLVSMQFDSDGREDTSNLRISNGNTAAFLTEHLAPQRPRKPAVEWQLDRPENYLLDLSGSYADTAKQAALLLHQRHEDPDPEDPIANDERAEMTALSNCLHKTLEELNQDAAERLQECRPNEPEPFSWAEVEPCVADCTEQAKARGIGVIRLDDPIYQLRYNQRRRQVAAWFMNAAVRRAKARPHFDSALLVHSVLEPETVASKPNSLHKHMAEVSGYGRKELERSLALSERALARRYLEENHTDLLVRLSDERTHHVLTDLFTHYSYDYAGAFNFVTTLMMNLVTEPAECDVLSIGVEGAVDDKGKQWLEGLCNGQHSRVLRSLLFPRYSAEDLKKPYKPPAEPQANRGNGRFRDTELAAMAETDLLEIDDLKTIDGLEISIEAAAGSYATLLTANLRMGSQVLMSVHGNMWAAIHHASHGIQARNRELAVVNKELEHLRLRKAELENQRWATERRITNLKGQKVELEDIRNKLSQMETQYHRLAQQKQLLAESAILGRMKLYSNSLEQLRRSLPELLGNMELMRFSKALQKDYFVFEISKHRPGSFGDRKAIALFGDFIQQEGSKEILASTNKRRSQAAAIASDVAEDVYVLVIPKTEAIAKMIAEISAVESRFLDSVHKLSELDNLVNNFPDTPAAAAAIATGRLASAREEMERAKKELKAFEQDAANQRDLTRQKEQYVGDLKAANDAANQIDQAEIDSKSTSRLYRVLNKPVFPLFVGLMELHNASSVWAAYNYQSRVKGSRSGNIKMFSAGTDLIAAGTAISERWMLGPSKVLSLKLSGKPGQAFTRRLGAPLTIRSGLGAAAGFLMALDAGFDSYYEYRMGNNATAVGYGLIAGSGVAFGFASLVGKPGLLLVLGPKGWLVAGVVLAVAGLATVFAFTDEPLDIWMRHGPFGSMAEKPYLKEPDIAYHRLISLLMGVSVRMEYNPLRQKAREGSLEGETAERIAALSNASERLVINSAIPGLFSSGMFAKVTVELQLFETIAVTRGRGQVWVNKFSGEDIKKYRLLTEQSETGAHIYLNAPANERRQLDSWFWERDVWETKTYRWQAKVQVQARKTADGLLMVFPAPPPEDPLTFDQDNDLHSKPNFKQKRQPYWYTQRVQENVE